MNSQFNNAELKLILSLIEEDLEYLTSNGYDKIKMDEDEFYERLDNDKKLIEKLKTTKPSTTNNNSDEFEKFKSASMQENTRLKSELDKLKNELSNNPFTEQIQYQQQIQTSIPQEKLTHIMIEGKYNMLIETLENMTVSMIQCKRDSIRLYEEDLISRQMVLDIDKYNNILKYPKSLTITDIQMINNLMNLYLIAVNKLKRLDTDIE